MNLTMCLIFLKECGWNRGELARGSDPGWGRESWESGSHVFRRQMEPHSKCVLRIIGKVEIQKILTDFLIQWDWGLLERSKFRDIRRMAL